MRILIICIATVLLFSCSSETDNTFTEVAISRVFTDSLSIRAIAPLDENGVWFAANNGRVGLIDGDTPKLATIHYEDSILAFRAIAKTKKAVLCSVSRAPQYCIKLE